jgi:type II secretory pathway pseudopilin PulG
VFLNSSRRGISLLELTIAIVLAGILLTLTASGMVNLNRQQRGERLGRAVLWEVSVARSFALRSGVAMALVADEAANTVTLRDEFGTVYRVSQFGPTSDYGATTLDVGTPGDSLAFSSRGYCLNCDSTTTVTAVTVGRTLTVKVNGLGVVELVGYNRT